MKLLSRLFRKPEPPAPLPVKPWSVVLYRHGAILHSHVNAPTKAQAVDLTIALSNGTWPYTAEESHTSVMEIKVAPKLTEGAGE